MLASPEYIESTITLFRDAAGANLATRGRVGNVIEIGPASGDDVMLTGDLHGHRRNLTLIRRIAALDSLPRRHLVLQEACHGGPMYPQNGGCMSHIVLEDIARLKVDNPDRVHFLLGNHELAELTDYPIQKNKQMLNVLFRLGLQYVYGPRPSASAMRCWSSYGAARWPSGLPAGYLSAIVSPKDLTNVPSTRRSSIGRSTPWNSTSEETSFTSCGGVIIVPRTPGFSRNWCRPAC